MVNPYRQAVMWHTIAMALIAPALTLRRFNNFLTIMVVVIGAHIMLTPFLPAIQWWSKYEAPIVSSKPTVPTPKATSPTAPQNNSLFIPALAMQEAVHEGASIYTLRYGVWHLPQSSTPDKGGNTVLAGHRFTYAGAAVFYNLDKVQAGNDIYMYWNHLRYHYQVSAVRVVAPTEISVEAPTAQPMLTIYTCTPLWSTKQRLVIQAKLMEVL